MPTILYPDVPDVDGVPSVNRSDSATTDNTTAINATSTDTTAVTEFWGIYDANGARIGVDASGGVTIEPGVLSFDYRKECRASDFPVEGGKFANYNKVETPAQPTVEIVFSGTSDQRAYFISAIDDACKSTDVYTVITPEVSYVNYTLESYNYQRSLSRGSHLYIVELQLVEIRTISAAYSNSTTKNATSPYSKPQVDGGKVQGSMAAGNEFAGKTVTK